MDGLRAPVELLAPLPAMLAGELEAWEGYVETLPDAFAPESAEGAPLGVIVRLHELEPSLDAWQEACTRAGFPTGDRWKRFIRWIARGLPNAPTTVPGVLPGRLYAVRHLNSDPDAALQVLAELRKHPGEPQLLAQGLIVASSRMHSAHRWPDVLPLAQEAAEVAETLSDSALLRSARFWTAAGLLHREEFSRGFELLESVVPLTPTGTQTVAYMMRGLHSGSPPSDPRDSARFKLVDLLGFTFRQVRGPEYVGGLGCLAEAYARAPDADSLWKRYERALDGLEGGAKSYEQVAKIARGRGCRQAAAAAEGR